MLLSLWLLGMVVGMGEADVCLDYVNMPGGDLPGMPVPANDTSPKEGCAALCNSTPHCVLFTYHRPGCDGKCSHKNGCCWLKSEETPGATPVEDPCTCSGYVRTPPSSYQPIHPPPPGALNVLYVNIDDLRPELVPYGQSYAHTPNLAKLAAGGLVFQNAYCQIAVCSPSRMSFLTGRRPHTSKIFNFINHFRQAECGLNEGKTEYSGEDIKVVKQVGCEWGGFFCGGSGQCCTLCTENKECQFWTYYPDTGKCHMKSSKGSPSAHGVAVSGRSGAYGAMSKWTTLPQRFKQNGYLTVQTGKIFHTEEGGVFNADPSLNGPGMPPNQDPRSWTDKLTMPAVNSVAPMIDCDNLKTNCLVDADIHGNVKDPKKEGSLCDRVIADDAIIKLRLAVEHKKREGTPFFMAVGFRKPHLSFRFPAPYLQFFPNVSKIPVAKYTTMDPSVPTIAHHDAVPQSGGPFVAVEAHVAQEWRLHYMAAVAWMDSQFGRVLDELDRLGESNNTVVVVHADHGWSLGEHGQYQKFTNWELGTRVPLIVRAPHIPASHGKRTSVLAELVDVFPTLLDMIGLPAMTNETLDGKSLLPVIRNPDNVTLARELKPFAWSQYMRCPADTANASMYWKGNSCLGTDRAEFPFMGYTIRTEQWRYTEWVRWDGATLSPMWEHVVGRELYSHEGDDGTDFDAFENVNEELQHPDVVKALSAQLHAVVV